ncbi:hypothetical protein Hypma_006799 [Hypsizygus marmoreus]|uniref:Uncharacterized protein n=1 Tax=Hypsizygus marmoreus TaxID=39966 RepID=A0A369K1B8_HYPMA|nr:hypothetical protein Hypma_006799 [Hypsizygus marmoreus]
MSVEHLFITRRLTAIAYGWGSSRGYLRFIVECPALLWRRGSSHVRHTYQTINASVAVQDSSHLYATSLVKI